MPQASLATSVAASLKKETEKSHVESESLISPKLVSLKERSDYADILRTFYGYFHPLEQRIARIVDASILPDISERRNASLILRDLHALGVDHSSLPQATDLPQITTIPQALGALYVMEGSTLGGRMIMKMLLKNPLLALDESQLNFFAGYGQETGNKWIAFQNILNSYDNHTPEIIASANHVFDQFALWIKSTLYHGSEN